MDISFIRTLTESPGVYLMKNKRGDIIYVGKAKNLRKRLFSYFSKGLKTRKTQSLVKSISSLETIITRNETEALLLELNLIKKHRPKFNIKLKDSDSYPFIAINLKKESPKFEIKYNNSDDRFTYFGPYPQKHMAYSLVDKINQAFQLRTCSDAEYKSRERACILYQIKKCSGPCVRLIDLKEYDKRVKQAVSLLEGNKSEEFRSYLENKMKEFAERENFEEAIAIREQINLLEGINQTQSIINSKDKQSKYYVNISREGSFYYIGVILLESGKVMDLSTFIFEDYDHLEENKTYLESFVSSFFFDKGKSMVVLPERISKELTKELSIVEKLPTTEQDNNLMLMILNNLNRQDTPLSEEKLENIKNFLHLEKVPSKIECFDISHFQGTSVVGSKVCFINGLPSKENYRKYKIREEKNDDFLNMYEVIKRRVLDVKDPLPDLMVIDGGKGQLKSAIKVFNELNIQGVEVISLAKDKVKNSFEEKEIKSTGERVFKIDGKEISISPGTESYKILTQIRNEAHRFAIKYHRELRKKKLIPN